MRNAETVLAIVRKRGERGLPLEDVYRMLYNPDLYLRAYGRLYKNKGAMTKGTLDETVDGMSLTKIKSLIDDIRQERHRWTPVRRVYIPKKKGGQRPLGLPIVRSYCPPSRVLSGLRCRRGSADSIPARSTVPYFARVVGNVVVSNVASSASSHHPNILG